jgi:hypothetical protein
VFPLIRLLALMFVHVFNESTNNPAPLKGVQGCNEF